MRGYARTLQHVGGNTSVTPGAVADTPLFAELLGEFHKVGLQTLQVSANGRVELSDPRLQVSDFLGGQNSRNAVGCSKFVSGFCESFLESSFGDLAVTALRRVDGGEITIHSR
ncbi:MAG: hypothetical protein ACLPVY_12595 [Acidimicrobiia bacterium]